MTRTKMGMVGVALVSGLVAGVAAAQEPQPAEQVEPLPPVTQPAPAPATQAERDRAEAAALRAEARLLRERLASDPDLVRESILYQYTGDQNLAPRVTELLKKAAAADKQADELERRALLPPTTRN